jgi:hypothetical protein
MEDARECAAAKLAELLKHPDDLNGKVTALRRKFAKEKVSIDAQLNSGAQSQLDNVQEGLQPQPQRRRRRDDQDAENHQNNDAVRVRRTARLVRNEQLLDWTTFRKGLFKLEKGPLQPLITAVPSENHRYTSDYTRYAISKLFFR